MAACLLVVLATAPSIDAIVCQNDLAIDATQLVKSSIAKTEPAPATALQGGGVGDVCPHGHCHHFSIYTASDTNRPVLTALLQTHAGQRDQGLPPSLPGSAPERPPRV